jgi:hypothetical protein
VIGLGAVGSMARSLPPVSEMTPAPARDTSYRPLIILLVLLSMAAAALVAFFAL